MPKPAIKKVEELTKTITVFSNFYDKILATLKEDTCDQRKLIKIKNAVIELPKEWKK